MKVLTIQHRCISVIIHYWVIYTNGYVNIYLCNYVLKSDNLVQEKANSPQIIRGSIVDQAGIELITFRQRKHRQLPIVQHVLFTHKNCAKIQLEWPGRGGTGQLNLMLRHRETNITHKGSINYRRLNWLPSVWAVQKKRMRLWMRNEKNVEHWSCLNSSFEVEICGDCFSIFWVPCGRMPCYQSPDRHK